jgi:electron-transferring-flavoprotein dehydrogenase
MKSAMLAAEAAFASIKAGSQGGDELNAYNEGWKKSWIYTDLYKVRNARPALAKLGVKLGTLYAGFDMWLNDLGLSFLLPWNMGHEPDHTQLKPASDCTKIFYPKPDGEITFDKLSSVFLSSTNHEEGQPIHLKLIDIMIPNLVNLPKFDGPEARFCPAGVYEYINDNTGKKKLQINAQNCVHCKTCDIKDPTQNINWVVPEGGSGPNYPNM